MFNYNKPKPYFMLNNNKITACGLIIEDNINKKYLLQYCNSYNKINKKWDLKQFDLFGGKIESKDKSPLFTIKRELFEETNGLINNIPFDKCTFYIVIKYLIAIIDKKYLNIPIDNTKFGIKEFHTNYNRTVHWVDINKLNKYNSKGGLSDFIYKKKIKLSNTLLKNY